MRRILRSLAFHISWSLAERAALAKANGERRYSEKLQRKSRIWFSRELWLAGLHSYAEHRAHVRNLKSNRRRECSGPPHLLGPDGAGREDAWPPRSDFPPANSLGGLL